MLKIVMFILSVAVAEEFEELDDESIELIEFLDGITRRRDLDPVVLVPGLAGSHLEYRNRTGTKWNTLWLNFGRTLPGLWQAYKKVLQVNYDPVTETYSSNPNIVTRPVDYGGLKGVDYLDPVVKTVTKMYHPLIRTLQETGYEEGKNLFGAPYDWRLANAKQVMSNGMYAQLKDLIERAFSINKGKKVHVIGHSCGCIFLRQFLSDYVTKEWKEKHIASFISTSGPYSGSVEAFAHLAAPRKWVIPTLSPNDVHELVQNFAGIYWMLPNMNAFPPSKVVARIPSLKTVITVENMTAAFATTGRRMKLQGVEMTQKHISHMEPPRVPVHIFVSNGKSTTKEVIYDGTANNWWKKAGTDVIQDGDGTVPIESLLAPTKWKTMQNEPVDLTVIPRESHLGIVGSKQYLLAVRDIVSR
ncbi:putative Lecithin:cholesterol/phospholipid:diacylglycerol acyltransferase [Monocercomonoides exilis]|uniref:putative Lecithin:cholesterol/phospholipid:diacylglycerol acyltransferase n=1 Tax=Monocercomonoides exilis TaxID=2049356 RepID=UPI0035596DD0|nr:putative Lecithin:cholesterol/phospholipid:diacylglycerol acyltransferase [Monocercomonoides exilis]|eukprot:MONOS_847.1-p1 / transcript=MONOS_847.1 / gene=MONOS_847 / organism=Monocercomonoides_exilis_PA203 / gene_product=Alpha / transcript_product=Alpha / location=Mono_scaffold00014:69593-71280(-) / protein_length=414 / sequence_SO=supercontig / SO=protein_coding / is_pseudo=false